MKISNIIVDNLCKHYVKNFNIIVKLNNHLLENDRNLFIIYIAKNYRIDK
jgi:hypothetical protein